MSKDRNDLESLQESVNWFSKEMMEKLKENDEKAHWSGMSNDLLIQLLMVEVGELASALVGLSCVEEIISECVDVANFAMMIADNKECGRW